MPGSREAVQLRAEILRYREQTRAGKYPTDLRERAEAYVQQRIGAGATSAEIAAELGVRKSTADRWASGGDHTGEGLLSAAPTNTGQARLN
jgi:transposase